MQGAIKPQIKPSFRYPSLKCYLSAIVLNGQRVGATLQAMPSNKVTGTNDIAAIQTLGTPSSCV